MNINLGNIFWTLLTSLDSHSAIFREKTCSRVVFSLLFYGNQRILKSTRKIQPKFRTWCLKCDSVAFDLSIILSHLSYHFRCSQVVTGSQTLRSNHFCLIFELLKKWSTFVISPESGLPSMRHFPDTIRDKSIFEVLHLLGASDNFWHLINRGSTLFYVYKKKLRE